jgi:hypothetical protein
MEAPDGGHDFAHAGGTFRIKRGPEGDAFKLDETRTRDALVFGPVTYEGMAAVWPHMTADSPTDTTATRSSSPARRAAQVAGGGSRVTDRALQPGADRQGPSSDPGLATYFLFHDCDLDTPNGR